MSESPLSLAKYQYANGDPIGYADPSGYVSIAELKTVTGIMTRLATFAGRIKRIVDIATRVIDAAETIAEMSRIFSGGTFALVQRGVDALQLAGTLDAGFANAISRRGISHAMESFLRNWQRVLASVVTHSGDRMPGYTGETRFEKFIRNLGMPAGSLLIQMPTPHARLVPNPMLAIPTGLKIKAGRSRLPIMLYLGGGENRGRMFGVASVADQSRASLTKVNQLFRMDWHPPDAATNRRAADGWLDGPFHYTVLDAPKRTSVI